MNLSFDINTQEGDKVIVSLVSSYPYLRDFAPADIPNFELLEVGIIRDKATSPIKMEIFGKIADILISIAEDNPEGILFYFCDIIEGIPNQRPNKTMASHEYRNELFKLLFKRYSPKARDHWSNYSWDNNLIERINRYISLSRKNSLFFGSHAGAERGAVFYSLACSCRLHHVNFFEYLSDVLNRVAQMPNGAPPEAFRHLLPDKWTKNQQGV